MRRIFIMVAAACLIGSAAFAHAFLDSASPAVGSEVSDPPAAVALTFSEPVEPLFSTIQVTDASGVRMDEGKPETQEDGRVLRVALKPLASGVFSVQWHVTSVDTHKTEGHFVFTVRP
jgi:copper resistance protein C